MTICSGRTGWRREKFFPRRNAIGFFVVLGVLVAFSYLIEHWRPTQHASWLIWDGIEAAVVPPSSAQPARPAFLVLISADDYQELFNRSSPLDSEGVAALVARALMRKPTKVFVDLETTDARFRELPGQISKQWCALDKDCRPESVQQLVAWAQAGAASGDEVTSLRPFLGGEPDDHQSVLAFMQPETDGRLRKVSRCIKVVTGSDTAIRETIVGAAASALSGHETRDSNCDDESTARVRPKFQRRLDRLLSVASIDAQSFVANPLAGRPATGGEVIFIGGSYSAADSFYAADGNEHPGVLVIAAMAIAMATHDEVIEHGLIFELGGAAIIGTLISVAAFYLRARFVPLGVLGIFLLAIALALVTRVALINVLGLFGVGVGILVHLLVEYQEQIEKAEHAATQGTHTHTGNNESNVAESTPGNSDVQPAAN